MSNKLKITLLLLILLTIVAVLVIFLGGQNIALFNPQGIVAQKERDLIAFAFTLALFIAIPVFGATFFIAFKYRESNKSASYSPDWQPGSKISALWWGIPAVIIAILAVINWNSTHDLDPYKPLETSVKPITIQVVALQWKWLFIYPEQNIASVNFVQFPKQTPINFELTADAPMNSFWIPQLGGQMYAMAGMGTSLHLMADQLGDFSGSAAEINGSGFSGMKFVARSSSMEDFDSWVEKIKRSENMLDMAEYNQLAKPSENNSVTYYATTEDSLYNKVMIKFMAPSYNNMIMSGMNY